MLSFSGSLKVLAAVEACDLRKGFNGLYALVTEKLDEDPRAGTLFVFSNCQHTWLKNPVLGWNWALAFDQTFERRTFSWPKHVVVR